MLKIEVCKFSEKFRLRFLTISLHNKLTFKGSQVYSQIRKKNVLFGIFFLVHGLSTCFLLQIYLCGRCSILEGLKWKKNISKTSVIFLEFYKLLPGINRMLKLRQKKGFMDLTVGVLNPVNVFLKEKGSIFNGFSKKNNCQRT